MSNKIKLNFINRSDDTKNSSVVIFQKNIAGSSDDTVIVWRVIENYGRLDNHPFIYSHSFEVTACDSYGNFVPQRIMTSGGQQFQVVKRAEGTVLELSGGLIDRPGEAMVINGLTFGAIDAQCYRDGKLLAARTMMAPGQNAVFAFEPRIWIGVVPQIEEGDVMSFGMASQINTEMNLSGITSADIVMTGGGSGSSTAFNFTLENITH